MEAQIHPPAFISPYEAAGYIGVTRRTVDRWISTGRLRAYRVGSRTVRIRVTDLEAFLQPIEVSA